MRLQSEVAMMEVNEDGSLVMMMMMMMMMCPALALREKTREESPYPYDDCMTD